MNVLERDEIISEFQSGRLKLEGLGVDFTKLAAEGHSYTSPFQQCSFDLCVGSVFIPETGDNKVGGVLNPLRGELQIPVGSSVLIRTREKITLPPDIGAICFSPSRLSLRGLLVLNMGHVDPGYSGHLHFTAINMSNSHFNLPHGSVICSMLLFRLKKPSVPFGSEHSIHLSGKDIPSVVHRYLPHLAKDFLQVESRGRRMAKREATKRLILIPFAFTVIAIIFTVAATLLPLHWTKPWVDPMQEIATRIVRVEETIKVQREMIDTLRAENANLRTRQSSSKSQR